MRLYIILPTSIVLGVITMATVVGNIFVIAAILLDRNLRSVANFLVASLAVADLMVAALVMPMAAVNEISGRWFLGRKLCDVWISFDVLCCTSSILHLVAISLDRYWAVTRVDYIHNRSAKRIGVMIALSWGLSTVISTPPLLGWRDWETSWNRTEQCLISQDWGYTVFSTVGAFYLPLFFITVVYLNVYMVARSRIQKRQFNRSPRASQEPCSVVKADEVSHPATTAEEGSQVGAHAGALTGAQSSAPQMSDLIIAGQKIGDLASSRQYLSVTPITCSPSSSPASSPRGSWLSLTRECLRSTSMKSTEKRAREKRAQGRERKAARTLAIITGSFIICWLPFFLLATVRPFCGPRCLTPNVVVSVTSWLGYLNSFLNPIIYTVFNPDFRTAFRKIIFRKYRRKRPTPQPEGGARKQESRS